MKKEKFLRKWVLKNFLFPLSLSTKVFVLLLLLLPYILSSCSYMSLVVSHTKTHTPAPQRRRYVMPYLIAVTVVLATTSCRCIYAKKKDIINQLIVSVALLFLV
jgi:hypothetical protein